MQKVVHMLWLQGEDVAPAWVQKNFDRARYLNPDFDVIVHDRQSVERIVSESEFDLPKKIKIQNLSDVFRMSLLHKGGGVWLDASAFLTQPLSAWLPKQIGDNGFFAFSYQDNWRLPISNWFLACDASSMIMDRWFNAAKSYWRFDLSAADDETNWRVLEGNPFEFMGLYSGYPNSVYPYFWSHYLFGYLLESDGGFASKWLDVPPLSSEDAHLVQFELRRREKKRKRILKQRLKRFMFPKKTKARDRELLMASPIQKLDWRIDIDFEYWAALADTLD